MDIRVTGQTQSANAILALRRQQSAVAKYQDQITSGMRIKVASDDPSAYIAVAQTRRTSERNATYQKTITSATADLNSGVSTLLNTKSLLTRAQQIASQAVDPSLGPTDREALASEIDSILDGVLSDANTQSQGSYQFGGSKISSPPFRVATTDPNGRIASVVYDGDSNRASVLIGPNGQTTETRYVGSNVYQAPAGNAFAALISLRNNLRGTQSSGNSAADYTARIGELNAASEQISNTIGEQSGTLSTLEAIQTSLSNAKLSADSRLGDLESADVIDAVVRLREQETAFQATLLVSSKLFGNTLLDYIR